MAFHIKNAETDALARRVARLRGVGLTEAVHRALEHELAREASAPSLVELGLDFARKFRERTQPGCGLPADKAFRDGLYEDG